MTVLVVEKGTRGRQDRSKTIRHNLELARVVLQKRVAQHGMYLPHFCRHSTLHNHRPSFLLFGHFNRPQPRKLAFLHVLWRHLRVLLFQRAFRRRTTGASVTDIGGLIHEAH